MGHIKGVNDAIKMDRVNNVYNSPKTTTTTTTSYQYDSTKVEIEDLSLSPTKNTNTTTQNISTNMKNANSIETIDLTNNKNNTSPSINNQNVDMTANKTNINTTSQQNNIDNKFSINNSKSTDINTTSQNNIDTKNINLNNTKNNNIDLTSKNNNIDNKFNINNSKNTNLNTTSQNNIDNKSINLNNTKNNNIELNSKNSNIDNKININNNKNTSINTNSKNSNIVNNNNLNNNNNKINLNSKSSNSNIDKKNISINNNKINITSKDMQTNIKDFNINSNFNQPSKTETNMNKINNNKDATELNVTLEDLKNMTPEEINLLIEKDKKAIKDLIKQKEKELEKAERIKNSYYWNGPGANPNMNKYNEASKEVSRLTREIHQLKEQKKMTKYNYEQYSKEYIEYQVKTDQVDSKDIEKNIRSSTTAGTYTQEKSFDYQKYSKDHNLNPYDVVKAANGNATGEYAEELNNLVKASAVNPDLEKMYKYIYEKEGPEAANKFLMDSKDTVNQILGQIKAQEFIQNISDGSDTKQLILDHINVTGKGLDDGVKSFGEGIKAWAESSDIYSIDEYERMYLGQALNEKGNGLDINYNISTSVGNMLPTIMVSSVPGLNTLGSVMMAVSAGGNSYHSALVEGYNVKTAIEYGVASGSSEAIFEKALGGLPGVGSSTDLGAFVAKTGIISEKGIIKSGLSFLGEMGKEGFEEYVQEIADQGLFRSGFLGEEVDVGKMLEDAKVSGLYGMATAGILQSPGAAINLSNSINNKANLNLNIGLDSNQELSQFGSKKNESNNQGQDFNRLKKSKELDTQIITDKIKTSKEKIDSNTRTIDNKTTKINNPSPINKNYNVENATKNTEIIDYNSTVKILDNQNININNSEEINIKIDNIIKTIDEYYSLFEEPGLESLMNYLIEEDESVVPDIGGKIRNSLRELSMFDIANSLTNYDLRYKNVDPEYSIYDFCTKHEGKYGFGVDQGIFRTFFYYEYNGKKISFEEAMEIVNKAKDNCDVIPIFDNYIAKQEFFIFRNKLNKLGFSAKDAEIIMHSIDTMGGVCTYANVCDLIFYKFRNMQEIFKEIFGYEMYVDENGHKILNTPELLLDLFVTVNDQKNGGLLFKDGRINKEYLADKIDPRGNRMIDTEYQQYLDRDGAGAATAIDLVNKFLKLKNPYINFESKVCIDNLKKQTYTKSEFKNIMINLKSEFYKGKHLSFSCYGTKDNFITMYAKNDYQEMKGGHIAPITYIGDDGLFVSSYGKEYYVSYDDLINGKKFIIKSEDIIFKDNSINDYNTFDSYSKTENYSSQIKSSKKAQKNNHPSLKDLSGNIDVDNMSLAAWLRYSKNIDASIELMQKKIARIKQDLKLLDDYMANINRLEKANKISYEQLMKEMDKVSKEREKKLQEINNIKKQYNILN
ncbi:MAG: hypothetical protein VZS44_08840 [Bacilli bacterium]|nr:hypothetical protein [Bacilli bacterium]